MKFKKVIAIIPYTSMEKVLDNLIGLGVDWVTVGKARGHGEYRNYFEKDCMTDCIRIEIFIEEEKARCITDAICYATYDGTSSDGMIAIQPIEEFIRVRDFKGEVANAR